jgi:gamma-glutamylcyclotransferase (GGCT)/AIG2-like uncharacterized protein YtfP
VTGQSLLVGQNLAGEIDAVFVYGTLMPGSKSEHVAQQAGKFRAVEAYLEGMLLYHFEPEGYPGILPQGIVSQTLDQANQPQPATANPTERIEGYLLYFDDITMALTLLDEFEDCYIDPPLYERQMMQVGPRDTLAWVYVYAKHDRLTQPGATLIANGRWQDFGESQGS